MLLNKTCAYFETLSNTITQEKVPRETFTYSKSNIETLKNVRNMFKVNNKDTRTTLYCIYR